jgi:hypothetical protein
MCSDYKLEIIIFVKIHHHIQLHNQIKKPHKNQNIIISTHVKLANKRWYSIGATNHSSHQIISMKNNMSRGET